jgi:predicted transcriptional regulator
VEDEDISGKSPETERLMQQKPINLFTSREEEFVNLLIETGTRENIAKILVYLANRPEVTFRDIEHGADMSQPEVSKATKYMSDLGWIKSWRIPGNDNRHPLKKYALAMPAIEIMASIEKKKKNEACNQIALVKKMRNYISES